MMFNGKKYGPKQFDQTMEFNGVIMPIPLKMLPCIHWFPASAAVIFDLEADRISSLSDPSIVESERGVVLSERRTGLENSPGDCCRNPCRQLLFKNILLAGDL
jgi:predicted Zn-dependent peptidase